jgi:ABC-2 type transport system ATP-binding protein
MQPQFTQTVEQFDYVRSTETVDNKLVIGLDDPEMHNPEVVRALVEAGANIQFVGEVRQRLEDVYLKLVKA